MRFDGTTSKAQVTPTSVVHSGGTSSFLTGNAVFRLHTWLEDTIQLTAEPVLPASLDDVERLLTTHLESLDSVYRRLA
jgi:hypothetical protein